jgi:hypothetical protein
MVTWSLWIMPTLCVGGLLSHACAQDQSGCHEVNDPCCPHEQAETPSDGQCSHESDCGQDPCSTTVTTTGRTAESHFDVQTQLPYPLSGCAEWTRFGHVAAQPRSGILRLPCSCTEHPCHDSDLPLLI